MTNVARALSWWAADNDLRYTFLKIDIFRCSLRMNNKSNFIRLSELTFVLLVGDGKTDVFGAM